MMNVGANIIETIEKKRLAWCGHLQIISEAPLVKRMDDERLGDEQKAVHMTSWKTEIGK